MRICMLSTTYPPRTGGLETHIAALSESLVRDGHHVTVFTNRDLPSQSADAIEQGVRVVRADALLQAGWEPDQVPWEESMFGLLRDVEMWLAGQKFDVIHTHTQAALLLAALSGLSADTPVVASPHETQPEADPCGTARSRFIYRAAAPDLVLVGSRRFGDQVVSLGVPEANVRLVYHGLPARPERVGRAEARRDLHDRLGVPVDGALIVLVGRFKPRKGQMRLLDALSAMASRERCHTVLAGSCNSADPQYLADIHKRIAKSQGGDLCTILEDCTDEIRDTIWAAADIATQPSSQEGLGLASIEAMLAGAPVVASDIDGLREVVTPATGILVDTANPDAYAAALDRLVDDPELRHHLGQHGERRAHDLFDAERAAHETLDVYRHAIALRRPAAAPINHREAR